MCFVDRTSEWAQQIDSSCRHLGLGPVSAFFCLPRPLCPLPRQQTHWVRPSQEESRQIKQQLLLKPAKEKSQFASVAENVVSRLHGMKQRRRCASL